MNKHTSLRTAGYVTGIVLLVIILALVLAISTGYLPWRDSYGDNLWPVQPTQVPVTGATATPLPTVEPTATPTPKPTPTPTPVPTPTPGVSLEEELPTFTITVTYGRGGTAIPFGANTVVQHGDILVVAVPDEGYAVDKFVVDGVDLGSVTEYEFVDVIAGHNVYISFKMQMFG